MSRHGSGLGWCFGRVWCGEYGVFFVVVEVGDLLWKRTRVRMRKSIMT